MPDQALYRQYCRQAPQVPLFAQPWHLDAVCVGGEWNAAVVEENGQLVAAMPYFLKRKGPFRYLAMPYFCKYLGPHLHPDIRKLSLEHKYYKELISQLPAVHAIKQEFHPSVTNWLPFYWQGYRQTTLYTYRLNLEGGAEKAWKVFRSGLRNEIKKAARSCEVKQLDDARPVFGLFEKRFREKGVNQPIPWEWFSRMDRALAEHQARTTFVCFNKEGHPAAGAYIAWDTQSAYLLLTGFDSQVKMPGATALAIWASIQFVAGKGLLFDFEGSMLPGVESFFRQFGGQQAPYFRVWKYPSRAFQLLEWLSKR
ncbi:MAG: GNAT family N-acetyltransferase [Phaeodactylibacter sp.]|nr:GNAT family N-acetyltransferase [Phaeodactylibacter sp.]